MHAHKPNFFFFCDCPFQTFFLPFSFPFSRSSYCCYLLRFIFFLAVPKSWLLIRDQACPLYDHFCTKTPSISKNDRYADRRILALLSAYQECLAIFKLMTSQVVQRARPFVYGHLGAKGLKFRGFIYAGL